MAKFDKEKIMQKNVYIKCDKKKQLKKIMEWADKNYKQNWGNAWKYAKLPIWISIYEDNFTYYREFYDYDYHEVRIKKTRTVKYNKTI